ncbi:hypothetical protein [Streptomyces sp. NPDC127038]|uniref:hypothetical protein n=1 Tax=Streptomyces sp. NPDC127038 TaxID=3347114 RepID=UPI00365A4A51
MTGMKRYAAGAVVAVALITAPTSAYGAPSHRAASASAGPAAVTALAAHAPARPAARTAPTARIVAPGEHVAEPGGAEFWLTPEGKHWTTPDDPEPQFRSVVDGNIDLGTPGVSAQSEGTAAGHWTLSGLYWGGKGTASRVTVRTTAGTLHAKLLELAGDPGWGVWYVSTDVAPGQDFSLRHVVVRDTVGRVYSRLDLS